MISRALASSYEVCGLLIGKIEGDTFRVVELYEARNISQTRELLFEIDPLDIYQAHVLAKKSCLEIIGVYHSHPALPRPSAHDLEGMKNWPLVWLIISSLDGSTSAFIVEGNEIRELEIVVI